MRERERERERENDFVEVSNNLIKYNYSVSTVKLTHGVSLIHHS